MVTWRGQLFLYSAVSVINDLRVDLGNELWVIRGIVLRQLDIMTRKSVRGMDFSEDNYGKACKCRCKSGLVSLVGV